MLFIGLLTMTLVMYEASAACREGGLVKYELLFTGMWTQDKFPKVYPIRRPNAEWGPAVGQTHADAFTLFKLDDYITNELQDYVERGDTSKLTAIGQRSEIMDIFSTRNLETGDGVGRTVVVADEERNFLSLVSKITPSPDWFVGLSGINLCEEGKWADRFSFELHPLDGGTQRGYTFSAPRWKSDPQQTISRITNMFPNHTADAFYYPHLDELPPIARVNIRLIQKFTSRRDGAVVEQGRGSSGNSHKPKMNIRPPVPGTIHRPAPMHPVESNSLLDNIYDMPSSTTATSSRTTTTPSNYVPTAYPRVYTPRGSGLRPWLVPKQTHSDSAMVLKDVMLTTPSAREDVDESQDNAKQEISVGQETTKQEQTTRRSFGIFHRDSVVNNSELNQQRVVTSDDEDELDDVEADKADELIGQRETIDGNLYLESATESEGSGTESDMEEQTTPTTILTTIYRGSTASNIQTAGTNNITQIGEDLEGLQKACLVSDWSEWSECSKSCGYGKKTRIRTIVKWTGDTPCPELQTDQLCGSMKLCNWNHFSLSFNSSSSVFNKGGSRRRPKTDRLDAKLPPDVKTGNNRQRVRTERRKLLLAH